MAKPKLSKITVTGNLRDDPVLREGAKGKFLTMRLIEDHQRFDRDTNKWVDDGIVGYDVAINKPSLIKNAFASLKSGDRITVSGAYEPVAYLTKEGQAALGHRINADTAAVDLTFVDVDINRPTPDPMVYDESPHYYDSTDMAADEMDERGNVL
ncbi:hypothetical protein MB46_19600 (plasmid) [Arthrobacter alpinus]|uniref:single-stranded DNA-binding protein n=1 Tax=Arthrobacter alpinus TaxID=656366 RepID=UPI0005CB39DF|nr:single-stranded DNA-binding protein [Arthrobacter alpinus]ALV47878.1 hypothetical protein MB46_19600 [Arthrobacter alpinus]